MTNSAVAFATSDYIGAELGTMAPMREEVSIENLKVEGTIPEAIRGTFYRTGPNPRFEPLGNYHIFDGDGMIHAIRFTDEGVHYTNRWVRTDKWKIEDQQGRSLFGGILDRMQSDPLVNSWPIGARAPANTHTFMHHGKLLALYESGMPWVVDPVTLETLGSEDYRGRITATAFSAHPHTDPKNGDLLNFGSNLDPGVPELTAFIIDKDNNIKLNVAFNGPYQSFVHDCMFTEDYFILPLQPLTRDVGRAARGEPYVKWEPERGTQLGILPRNATDPSQVRWIEMEGCSFFHFYNAYQIDGDTLVIDAAVSNEAPGVLEGAPGELGRPERWHVDLRAGTAKRSRLFEEGMDFPRIDERLQGYRHNVGISVGNSGTGPQIEMDTIYRIEPDTGRLTKRELPAGQKCSEAVFIPADPAGRLEEGYVASLIYEPDSGTSHLLILDADNIAAEPVATVFIPKRIPVGFHANWVSDLPGYPQGDY